MKLPPLPKDWKILLEQSFDKKTIDETLKGLIHNLSTIDVDSIAPSPHQIFRALELTPVKEVKTIIVGQDPYTKSTGERVANGLAFSIEKGRPITGSLRSIYKCLVEQGFEESIPTNGDLTHWAKKGVLLLNTHLTTSRTEALAHRFVGWPQLTKKIIHSITKQRQGLVIMLWGAKAFDLEEWVQNPNHHKIIKSSHPSPLGWLKSCQGFPAFKDSHCFKSANQFLGRRAIEWNDSTNR